MSPLRTGAFALRGEVARPELLTVGDLTKRWRQRREEVVFNCLKDGPRRHSFAGPLLRDVVADAGPEFGGPGRKARTRFLLAVSGDDGHHTVLSWAEIDPDFGDVPVLLATELDGRGLEDEGPQLVVPSDYCGARYISAVTSVRVARWPDAPTAAAAPAEWPQAAAPGLAAGAPSLRRAAGALPVAAGSGDGE
ncbi:molybdopterin-dependent oxidoreductase [Streptomyces sp. DW26H14]|uniref:molybdopterin-dependent oxidoreductase n=1 Tax=Streptomyces sp. DW26H14 TaxID=3435395 RepID=UPI00403D72CB